MVAIVSYIQENTERGSGFLKAGQLVHSRRAELRLKTHPQAPWRIKSPARRGPPGKPDHHLNREETSALPLCSCPKHQVYPKDLESVRNCRSIEEDWGLPLAHCYGDSCLDAEGNFVVGSSGFVEELFV